MSDREKIIRAYGILWRCSSTDRMVHDARQVLRDGLTTEEKMRGVKLAIELYQAPSEDEVLRLGE